MLFSQAYKLSPKKSDREWFDPILYHDTRLFIDPFLIFRSSYPAFRNGHKELIQFFNKVFQLAAQSGGRRKHLAYRKLENMLLFPEVSELCLGYTSEGRKGSGSGKGFSKVIASGVMQSISMGLTEVTHFEEIDLFHEGIGPDRISDITANILKPRLIHYTQEICSRHKIPLREFNLQHASFDYDHLRWFDEKVRLPENPVDKKPVLLVPKQYLRALPTISPEEFWDYMWDNKADQLRTDFNFEVKSKVNKRDIIAFAQENRFEVREFLEHIEGRARPTPYDLRDDPRGLYQWAPATKEFTDRHPLKLAAQSAQDVERAVQSMVDQFQLFVEKNNGYKLLWDGGRSKSEEAAQLLFLGIVKNYCVANDIDISREANIGSGPVDFKFSRGYELRTLLEVKLAKNSKFWNGLRKQLPRYMEAESVNVGYYMVIAYSKQDFRRASKVQAVVGEVSRELGITLRTVVIDASRGKVPASGL